MSEQMNEIVRAEQLRADATRFLSDGIKQALGRCGPVVYSGSYYLDLMAWPDLDIYIPYDASSEYLSSFMQIGPDLAMVCDVISLRYKNHVTHPVDPLPNGLYWGVRIKQNVEWTWKLDIWSLPSEDINRNQSELTRLKAKLTPESRRLILNVKNELLTPEGRTPLFSGYPIYCAVIDHGLRSISEIKKYLVSQGIAL